MGTKPKYILKTKYNGYLWTRQELVKQWENELLNDLLPNETLEKRKKQYTFKQWLENLMSTGEYEYIK